MLEQSQLAEARELIKNKRYDEARTLLEAISFNETAQKWLAKLDEIAPRPAQKSIFDEDIADPFASSSTYGGGYRRDDTSGLTDEEKFERVKILIKDKKFDEARVILQTLSGNPSAQKLLSKLNEMTSRGTSSTNNYQSGPIPTDQSFGKKTKSSNQRARGKRPKTFVDYVLSAVGGLIVLVIFVFARQYVRYGDFNVFHSDQTFENESIKFTYGWRWKNEGEDSDWCKNADSDVNCFAYLIRRTTIGDFYAAWIGIAEFENENGYQGSIEETAADVWADYVQEFPDITLRTQYTQVIDGVTAVAYEFNYGESGGLSEFEKRLYLYRDPTHFMVIAISTSGDEAYQRRRSEIDKILASIDLKTP